MRNSIKIGLAVAALGGTVALATPLGAQAAALITSGDIKDQTIQSRDIGSQGVGTSEIRNQDIQSVDIDAEAVGQSEIRTGSVHHTELSPGVWDMVKKGKTAHDDNKGQASKISDLEDRVEAEEAEGDNVGLNTVRAGEPYTQTATPGVSVAFTKCGPGKVAISGGYRLNGHAAEAFQGGGQPVDGLTVIASEPGGVVGGELVNTYQHPDFPQTESGAFEPNAWVVTFHNATETAKDVRVAVVCVTP